MDLSKFKLGPRLTEAFKANNGPEVRLHTEMFQELAPGLHAANPEYEFRLDSERYDNHLRKDSDGTQYLLATLVEVWHRKVLIGRVRAGYFRRRYSLELSAIIRGGIAEQTTTTDVQRAASFVKRKMLPVSDEGILTSKIRDVQIMLASAEHKYSHSLYSAKVSVSELLGEFAVKNIDAFVAAYPNNADVAALAKAVKHNQENANVTSMHEAFERGSLRTAAELDNGMWLVHSKAHPNEHTPTPWDDLAYEIRAKLGLLRMSEDGTILEGVGVRVNATTFALCPEDSHGA